MTQRTVACAWAVATLALAVGTASAAPKAAPGPSTRGGQPGQVTKPSGQASKPAEPAKPAETGPAAGAPKAQQPKADAREFIEGLYRRLARFSKESKDLSALHQAIGDDLQGVVRFDEMARQTLPSTWDTLQADQRSEFTQLLAKMVVNTYVKRFRPGSEIGIQYKQVRPLGPGRSEVQTAITVQKTSADVSYLLIGLDGRWWVYDIVVDEASQVQSYRQNFAKILNKEGWSGLIARMKKAASKKAG